MPAQSPPPSEDLLFSSPASSSTGSHASSSGSGMSDERNADSVLFKLETVAQMHAAQQQQQARQPSQLARLAAPAPASKAGSGLIDIKELAAPGNAPAAAAPAPAAPQPRPAAEGSGLIDINKLATAEASSHGGSSPSVSTSSALLSSSSMLGVVPSSEANAVPGKSPSRTPLIVLSVLALLALGAAVTAIVLRGL